MLLCMKLNNHMRKLEGHKQCRQTGTFYNASSLHMKGKPSQHQQQYGTRTVCCSSIFGRSKWAASNRLTVLAGILTAGISCPTHLDAADLRHDTFLVTEGQALVSAIGKPQAGKAFGDLADIFMETVFTKWSTLPPQ